MKLLVNITLLTAALSGALLTPVAFADPASSSVKSVFQNEDQQTAYAIGASFGHYIDNSLQEQNKIGVNLDRKAILAGLQDALLDKSKLSDKEITNTLELFESRVKAATEQQMAKTAAENRKKGDAWRAAFAKEKGVKKTASGLLYKIEQPGSGASPKPTDTIVVNYTGQLINGSEFDSSYKRHEPLSFRLDGVIPGWTEGLQLIKKGGKIKLVIPPDLAYGNNDMPGIAPDSTLVFEVELLDIKPAPAANSDQQQAPATDKK